MMQHESSHAHGLADQRKLHHESYVYAVAHQIRIEQNYRNKQLLN